MKENIKLTLPNLLQESIQKFGQNNAYSFVGEKALNYQQTGNQIKSLTAYLEKIGTQPGDKVAILSNNMPNWGISFWAITAMRAVAVPLLPDFSPEEIQHILEHSDAKAIFISTSLIRKIENWHSEKLKHKIKIEDFSVIESSCSNVKFIPGESPQKKYTVEEDDLAEIIYTSGTTGKSKGVMLSHKNVCFTALKGKKVQKINDSDRFLSILPLSHTYEKTLSLILGTISGASIYYLKQPPIASVLLNAIKKVKPTVILSVPLIIEKIYRNKILPKFQKNIIIKNLYKITPVRKTLNKMAGKKLMKTFGGEIRFFGIGGAKLDKEVERFLLEAKFPYAIGYGLTETAPLLAGTNPQTVSLQSTGPAIEGVELKIHKPDAITGEGEIWAKGPNVMLGYYKNPQLTKEVITEDGWFKTGDLGVFDNNNFLFIKGRLKNMIVGSSGENIYPEEIESVINKYRYVVESLVIPQKGKLVALVHFNYEELEQKYIHLRNEITDLVEQKVNELSGDLQKYINTKVNKFSRVHQIVPQPVPFQRTPTQKIKRYLYQKYNE